MKTGNICKEHPELYGLRHNGGNCPACVKLKLKAKPVDKEVRAAYGRAYRAANRERVSAVNAEWVAKNKDRVRNNNLRRTGFTLALFTETLSRQNHKCGICECDLTELPQKQVHADHCHSTGVPRGVLCHYCNIALGAFRDDPEILRKAAAYLSNPPLRLA